MYKTKADLLAFLKQLRKQYPEFNIGATNHTIIHYEKKGIIKQPKLCIQVSRLHKWRFYTDDEISDIGIAIVNYKKSLKRAKNEKEIKST